MAAKDIQIRPMTMDDYEEVFEMWQSISGFGIRSWDDSKEGIEKFIARNPGLSVVAIHDRRQKRMLISCMCATGISHVGHRTGYGGML